MTATLAAALAALALVDSTSFGTLLIPIWLLLAPGRLHAGRVLVFLGTVAAFYFALGLLLLGGPRLFLGGLETLLEHPGVARLQLVVGVALLVWSFRIGKPAKGPDGQPQPGRIERWRGRVLGESGPSGRWGLVALALGATAVEAATMLPYLAATGLLATSDLPTLGRVAALGAYVVVMILPALVLLVVRLLARRQVEPLLRRIGQWMEKNGAETTAWVVGILGFLIARDALLRVPELSQVLPMG